MKSLLLIVFQKRLTTHFCSLSFSNNTKQWAQKLSACFQHFEGIVLNAAQFSHNDYIIVLMLCLSRFRL